MNHTSKKLLATTGAAVLLATTALAGGAAAVLAQDEVTIEWWHITTDDPLKQVWQDAADAYSEATEGVTVDVNVLENEQFKTIITTNMQAGDPPDLFQSWGGGTLAQQAEIGFVKELGEPEWLSQVSAGANSLYNVDGVQYGASYDQGMVGFWYNKDLLAQAGYDAFPATWAEFLEMVQALKDNDIVPIALGEGEKWPGHFWFAYLALRECGAEGMIAAGADGSFDADCFVKAGEDLKALVDLDPFQPDFLAAPYGEAAGQAAYVANGDAAMELMGHWAPGTQVANSANGEGLGEALGFAAFPTVDGGAGTAAEAFGGGNGFVLGANAPDETVDFLNYITSLEVAEQTGATGQLLPPTIGSESVVTDPNLQALVALLGESDYVQLYLDQAYAPAVGEAVNDSVQGLLGGALSPEELAGAIADAARAAAE